MEVEITHTGLGHIQNASVRPYGKNHITDFMDVWLPNSTIGLDHIFYEDGEVEFRVMGYKLSNLPPGDGQ